MAPRAREPEADPDHPNFTDFTWAPSDEPHATRRQIILRKHPEIKQLYGYDSNQAYFTWACIVIQLGCAYLFRDYSWGWIWFLAYSFGGVINHSLSLANHELSHGMMCEKMFWNKVLGVICNIPQGLPTFVLFQKYHLEHHLYQGLDKIDVDVPTALEGRLLGSFLGKIVFLIIQPLTYSLRPVIVAPKKVTLWEIANVSTVIASNYLIWHFWGIKPVVYLAGGTVVGMVIHPACGHLIAEHFEFKKGQETYSYYGPMNKICYNVGYHNEHHDFPKVPGSRLPLVRKMAPEFYDTLPHFDSWFYPMWEFAVSKMTPFSRVMRKQNTSKLFMMNQKMGKNAW